MKYTNIKSSNVEWLGDIPSHWEIKRGKNCLTLLSRSVLDDDDIITCFRDGEVTLRKNRREEGFTNALLEIGYQGVNAGDLVVHGMDGFAGAIGISDSRGKASPVLNVMDSPNCKRFLMYYLRSLANKEVFLSLSTGIRVRSCDLRWNKLAVLPFILPPLPEQTAIAAYLDEKCGTIDEIIAEAKASIEEYKAWKSSVIFEAVTKGLDPHAEMKDSGVEWIGKVPRHWKKTPVKSIARFINGYAFSSDLLIPNALFPVIRIGDILDNGSVNFKHALGIDELINNLEGFTIQKNDVLIAMSGATTGKVCVITEAPPKAFINQRVGIVRSCKHSKYLYHCLSTDIFKEYVLLLSAGSAQPNLSTAGIKNYQIICPPDNEIESITRYLDEKCAAIDGIIAEKEALIADMEAYKKSLIFETVTGKRKVC